MLILIAGITGNIGSKAAAYALAHDHTVRGLGRSPSNLRPSVHGQLESFVTSSTYYDTRALDAACVGVDAVVCAYSGLPELHLDAQLLLLRAAERAGVRRFLAAGWNYDWRGLALGEEPVYDAAIMFHRQVALTSGVKVCHVFSGMLVDVFFGRWFGPGDVGGVWDGVAAVEGRPEREMDVWGSGDEVWDFTTEDDAAAWGVEVVTGPDGERGGFVSVCSFSCGLNEVRKVYERVRGVQVKVNRRGTVEDLERMAVKLKEERGGLTKFWDWHRFWFHLFSVQGRWNLTDLQNDRFPNVTPTGLEQYLRDHPEV